MLTDKKIKEWRKWGKEEFISHRNMMRRNMFHPDYCTKEKRDAIHDNYGDSYLLREERINQLKTKWNYSDEMVATALDSFKSGYNSSRQWYEKADIKYQAILDKYTSIFEEASKIARKVDVSDLQDGFPCGSAHLYLQRYSEAEDLRKALAHFNGDSHSDYYKYKLPILIPNHGQCIVFDERICNEVNKFLREKGIFASIYSWID